MTSALVMVESRCAMTTEVRPRSTTFRLSWMIFSVRESMLAVASSSTMMRGSATMALAKLMSCRWPMLRLLPRCWSIVS